MSNKLMTVHEVAEILAVPVSRVYTCWREWDLPMYRVGQQLRCDPDELHEWIKAQRAR